MSRSAGNEVESAAKRLTALTTVIGSQLPGMTFFLNLAPPIFPALTLLTGGGTLALFLVIYFRRESKAKSITHGAIWIGIAVTLAIIYGLVFSYVTIGPPPLRNERVRYQIGFGLSSFSLTDGAQRVAREQHLQTEEELILAFGAYDQSAMELVWKGWTILAAAAIVTVLFVATYAFWTIGLAHLARALRPPQAKRRPARSGKAAELT